MEVPQNHKRFTCDLTQADRLALYDYVVEETKKQRSRSQITENDSDLFVDLAAKITQGLKNDLLLNLWLRTFSLSSYMSFVASQTELIVGFLWGFFFVESILFLKATTKIQDHKMLVCCTLWSSPSWKTSVLCPWHMYYGYLSGWIFCLCCSYLQVA